MAYQLIYTSVRRGLIPGRSGYTVAARHRQIRDRLVAELERISSYTFAKSGSSPVIYAHRQLEVSGTEFHILSRIVDAGSDYTGRTNHLAHHLVCEPGEIARCKVTPAEVMLQFSWRDTYDEEPRYLSDQEEVDLAGFAEQERLPAEVWRSLRGTAADAALPLEGEAARAGAVFVVPPDDPSWPPKLLALFAESLQLAALDAHDPAAGWRYPFTSYLQPTDDLADFKWVACEPDHALLGKAGRRRLLDLDVLGATVPASKLAQLAETGRPAITIRAPSPPPPRPSAIATPPNPRSAQQVTAPVEEPVEEATVRPVEQPVAAVGSRAVQLTQNPVTVPQPPNSLAETPLPDAPEKLSLFGDRRLLIPSLIAVFIGTLVILQLTRGIEPWAKLKAETELALSRNDFVTANRILDQMKQERPAWTERIERHRQTEVLPRLLDEAENAVTYLRDSPDPSIAEYRLGLAKAELGKVEGFARAYPNKALIAEIGDLERRIERLWRAWENRAAAADRRDPDEAVVEKAPTVEPEKVPGKVEVDPHRVVLPPVIYLVLNRRLTSVSLPESLPDLTSGPGGDKRVSLEHAALDAASHPWEKAAGFESHDYKFPESAAEDDGSPMLPTAGKFEVQLRFQGKSKLQLQPTAASSGTIWGARGNSLLRFAGGEKRFWILLWDGAALPVPAQAALELRGSKLVPSDALGRFLAALTPPAAGAVPPGQLVMRYLPPDAAVQAGDMPIQSAALSLPVEDASAIAIDFADFTTGRAAVIAQLEGQLAERERAIENARDFLEWKDRCDRFDESMRGLATRVLGENHEILIRNPVLLDREVPAQRRLAVKNFCADFLRDFWRHLKALNVGKEDLDLIDEALSQDEFWARWKSGDIGSADGEDFAEFMETFVDKGRKLTSRLKIRTDDPDQPFRFTYRISSGRARGELDTMADAWDKVFSGETGEGLWEFSKEPRPGVPEEIESIGRYRAEVLGLSDRLDKMRSGSLATLALEQGSPPPGTYQFDLIMASEEILTFAKIVLPTP